MIRSLENKKAIVLEDRKAMLIDPDGLNHKGVLNYSGHEKREKLKPGTSLIIVPGPFFRAYTPEMKKKKIFRKNLRNYFCLPNNKY
jgi:hypothetical protein